MTSEDKIWKVAASAVARRDQRLLGYCDAALRGGRRRAEAGMRHVLLHLEYLDNEAKRIHRP